MKTRVISITMAIILIFIMVACSSSSGTKLSGTYVSYPESYNFSGDRFKLTTYHDASLSGGGLTIDEEEGKYSISDGKIEFVFDTGKIRVYDFSRTENTIQLNRSQYSKR